MSLARSKKAGCCWPKPTKIAALRRNLERPALQRLLDDELGKVDQIVVYKIDRLTRSLADFAKLVERPDGAGHPSSRSPSRSTAKWLDERIRDKIEASQRQGLWMRGLVRRLDADRRTLKTRQ